MQIQLKPRQKKEKEPLKNQKLRPEQISTVKCILLGDQLGTFWKVHAIVLIVLYAALAIVCLAAWDFDFAITSKGTNSLFWSVICTQGVLWLHLFNTCSLIWVAVVFSREWRNCRNHVFFSHGLKKCRNFLLSCAICSLGVFSLIVCYVDHQDTSTFGICPVATFIILSHISSLLFKYEFSKKLTELRVAVKNPDQYDNKEVLSKSV